MRAGNGFEEALEQILQVVRLGLVPGGERLPAERELARRLGVSRMTLRRALDTLERQGRVRRVIGRSGGTFVEAPPRVECDLTTVVGFTETVLDEIVRHTAPAAYPLPRVYQEG